MAYLQSNSRDLYPCCTISTFYGVGRQGVCDAFIPQFSHLLHGNDAPHLTKLRR